MVGVESLQVHMVQFIILGRMAKHYLSLMATKKYLPKEIGRYLKQLNMVICLTLIQIIVYYSDQPFLYS